jgi:hypothetical protein
VVLTGLLDIEIDQATGEHEPPRASALPGAKIERILLPQANIYLERLNSPSKYLTEVPASRNPMIDFSSDTPMQH